MAFAESPELPILKVPMSVARVYLWSAPESPKNVPSVPIVHVAVPKSVSVEPVNVRSVFIPNGLPVCLSISDW